MNQRILFVDDEPNMLASVQRTLRGRFDLAVALGGREALRVFAPGQAFAVVVADMRMPGMDGLELLAHVKEIAPDTVRIMLTGFADLDTSIRAVNEGHVFRFLTKPCEEETLIKAMEAAVEQHRLITAERQLLAETLNGCVRVLTDVLSMSNPVLFGKASRLRRYVRHILARIALPDAWQYEVAAMLSQIGSITLPPETIQKIRTGHVLSGEEERMVEMCPRASSSLVGRIPRLESVARMIAGLRPQDLSDGLRPSAIEAMGAGILRVAVEFDRRTRQGTAVPVAIAQMRQNPLYGPEFLSALEDIEVKAPASHPPVGLPADEADAAVALAQGGGGEAGDV